MTEVEYVIATNLAKVLAVQAILRDILPGADFGVGKEELSEIVIPLGNISARMSELITVEG